MIGLLLGMSLFAMFFFISLYMQQVLGYDPLKAGLAYLPLAGLIILSAGGADSWWRSFGFKPVLIVGLLFTAAGLFWFSRVSAPGGSYVGDVLFPEMLAAVGLGLSFVPVHDRLVAARAVRGRAGVRPDQHVAAGRRGARPRDPLHDRHQPHAGRVRLRRPGAEIALTEGFQDAFFAGGVIALIGAVLAMVLISTANSRRMAEEADGGASSPAVPA